MFTKKSRRYYERQPSALPVQVRYFLDTPDSIIEESQLINVSRGGARFILSREVQMGQPVELTLAISRLLRAYDKNEKTYRVWGIIRSVACLMNESMAPSGYEIGVAFIGATPPDGYLEDTTKRYDLKPTPDAQGLWPYRELSLREREMMANW